MFFFFIRASEQSVPHADLMLVVQEMVPWFIFHITWSVTTFSLCIDIILNTVVKWGQGKDIESYCNN